MCIPQHCYVHICPKTNQRCKCERVFDASVEAKRRKWRKWSLKQFFNKRWHIEEPPSKRLSFRLVDAACRDRRGVRERERGAAWSSPPELTSEGALFVEEKVEVTEQCCQTLSCCLSWSHWSLGPRRWRSRSDGGCAKEWPGCVHLAQFGPVTVASL